MTHSCPLVSNLRRSLLVKVVARQLLSREDVALVVELTATKLAGIIQAQSVRFHVDEGSHIWIPHVYHSPSLWGSDAVKEQRFRNIATLASQTRCQPGGLVRSVIETALPVIVGRNGQPTTTSDSPAEISELDVHSMMIVPLKSTITLGAIQVFNKERDAGTDGYFTEADLELLQEIAEYSSAIIHRMLDAKFLPSPHDNARYISLLTGRPLISTLENVEIDEGLLADVGAVAIRTEGIFPYQRLGEKSISAIMTNPLDYLRQESFTERTGLSIDEISVTSTTLFETLVSNYVKTQNRVAQVEDVDLESVAEVITSTYTTAQRAEIHVTDLENEESGPLIQLANRIIEDAFFCGASDIHIEPTQKDLLVRYRIDGLCQDKLHLPKATARALVARLKVMCNLDISETRLPQDGRIVFKKFSKRKLDIDLRVAVAPVNFGEKVTLRVLDKAKSMLPLSALGFSDENLAKYRDCVSRPYGMILHCGPTGSGKSMTLYSALSELNTRDTNIITAEDPIEYTLPGLNQTQMNRQIGLTFERALRSFLRMDPDIILVGEIRDQETAQIAVEAALTGHLLVSTLHTNDAPTTIARLCEMGIEPFNISAAMVCVCAQRLIRRVCKRCSIPYEPKGRDEELIHRAIGFTGPIRRANAQGCPACGGVGFKGRVGIHELMLNDEELTEAINRVSEAAELKRIAIQGGMKTLHQDAMLKVSLGLTTLEEALVTSPPDIVRTRAPITSFSA